MNRILACRVCLAYDTRLYSIIDGQFRDIYEKLAEASLDTDDMLPTSVCYLCFALMKKMVQFRNRSQKANRILQQMINSGLELPVSSLDMLVKNQTGIFWTLGISDIERTITTSVEFDVKMEIEFVKSEMDIDGMSDQNEDYSDSMPVYKDSASDSEDNLPLQNISEQCTTDRVNVKIENTPDVRLKKSSGHEGAEPPKKWKIDKNEAENELGNIQAPIRKIEKDEEPREKIENQNQSAFFINDTITPPKDIFTCDLCKNEYQCKILLESHITKSHVIELNRKHSINSDLNLTNQCKSTNLLKVQEIQYNDNRKENDRRENKLSDNTSQYKCQYCMKRFNSHFHLTRHVRVHTKEKPYKCDICKKCFSRNDYLTEHSRVHTKEKPFKCAICKRGFSQNAHLTAHLRVHTKEKNFQCDVCGKSFSKKGHLTRHSRVHTKEKPFKCDKCEKRFSRNDYLTKHFRVHTKKKLLINVIYAKKAFPVTKKIFGG